MKCACEDAPCPRQAEPGERYCWYCVRMYPCDHAAMDRAGRIKEPS